VRSAYNRVLHSRPRIHETSVVHQPLHVAISHVAMSHPLIFSIMS